MNIGGYWTFNLLIPHLMPSDASEIYDLNGICNDILISLISGHTSIIAKFTMHNVDFALYALSIFFEL